MEKAQSGEMGEINSDDLLQIYAEFKREIDFNIEMPQLLLEVDCLREFLITSGKIEIRKIKSQFDPLLNYMETENETINDSDFKQIFEQLDNINDHSLMPYIFGQLSK